jgi:hypothetical protein
VRNLVGPALWFGALGVSLGVGQRFDGVAWVAILAALTVLVIGFPMRPDRPTVDDAIDRFFAGVRAMADLVLAPYRFVRFLIETGARRPIALAIGAAVWTGAAIAICVVIHARG